MQPGSSKLSEFKNLIAALKSYAKNPLRSMRNVPNLSWFQILLAQGFISLFSGLLFGIINSLQSTSHSWYWTFFGGVIFGPIISTFTCGIMAIYLYYSFLSVSQQSLPVRTLFTVVVFSCIPFFIFGSASPLFFPATLLGFFATILLLTVGLVENFGLPKGLVFKISSVMFGFFALVWFFQYLMNLN